MFANVRVCYSKTINKHKNAMKEEIRVITDERGSNLALPDMSSEYSGPDTDISSPLSGPLLHIPRLLSLLIHSHIKHSAAHNGKIDQAQQAQTPKRDNKPNLETPRTPACIMRRSI